jgi:hypothetical protein
VPSTTVTMTRNEPAHSDHLLLVNWIWLRRHASGQRG